MQNPHQTRPDNPADRHSDPDQKLAYAISHDLGAPLRGATRFAQLLAEEHGPQFNDEARSWLEYIRHDTARALRMVDGLAAYIRLNSAPLHPQWLDLPAACRSAWQEVRRRQPAHESAMALDVAPEIHADPQHLDDLLSTLLDNALRHHPRTCPIVLKVSTRVVGERVQLCCDDNGLGVAAADHHRLTEAFWQLRPDANGDSLGLGLSRCARIVARMQGQITFASSPLGGLSVCCTLPFSLFNRTGIQADE